MFKQFYQYKITNNDYKRNKGKQNRTDGIHKQPTDNDIDIKSNNASVHIIAVPIISKPSSRSIIINNSASNSRISSSGTHAPSGYVEYVHDDDNTSSEAVGG